MSVCAAGDGESAITWGELYKHIRISWRKTITGAWDSQLLLLTNCLPVRIIMEGWRVGGWCNANVSDLSWCEVYDLYPLTGLGIIRSLRLQLNSLSSRPLWYLRYCIIYRPQSDIRRCLVSPFVDVVDKAALNISNRNRESLNSLLHGPWASTHRHTGSSEWLYFNTSQWDSNVINVNKILPNISPSQNCSAILHSRCKSSEFSWLGTFEKY